MKLNTCIAIKRVEREALMSAPTEIISFIIHRRKFFLIPIIIALLTFAAVVVVSEYSAVAPFLYADF